MSSQLPYLESSVEKGQCEPKYSCTLKKNPVCLERSQANIFLLLFIPGHCAAIPSSHIVSLFKQQNKLNRKKKQAIQRGYHNFPFQGTETTLKQHKYSNETEHHANCPVVGISRHHSIWAALNAPRVRSIDRASGLRAKQSYRIAPKGKGSLTSLQEVGREG